MVSAQQAMLGVEEFLEPFGLTNRQWLPLGYVELGGPGRDRFDAREAVGPR